MPTNLRDCLFAEFIGTFALVFCGVGAIVTDQVFGGLGNVGIALVFGMIVMVMIYALGDISGAHFNPAVSVGFFLAKRFPISWVLPYVISQILAALVAVALLKFLFSNIPNAVNTPNELINFGVTTSKIGLLQGFIMEAVITFFLMFVILRVATGAKEKGLMAGVAIGSTVAIGAAFAGPLTNASMNPARSIGPAVMSADFSQLWLFCLAPLVGSALAVYSCRITSFDGCCEPEIASDKSCETSNSSC